jgi:organic radical activating enzyme
MKFSETKYPIMERFYTIQGEGVYTGFPAWFIRLAGCDVGCVWCDVKESWSTANYPVLDSEFLAQEASLSGTKIVVITGGEPCLYDLTVLCNALHQKGLKVHLETSASSPILGDFDWICISPKKFKAAIPSELIKANELKVVVFHPSDIEWAQSFVKDISINCKLLLQPEWSKSNKVLPLCIDFVKKNTNWQISLQTHKFMQIP